MQNLLASGHLHSCRGRSNVTAKDDMLSMGGAPAPPQAQTVAQASAEPPAQARLSLFDLAEAAATLSTASPAPPNSKPTKGRAQAANDRGANQSAPAVPKGPRSVRKSKGQSSSPDAEGSAAAAGVSANHAAAASDGMQTRGLATRRPSVEKQPSERSPLPSKPKAKANKVSKAQRQLPQPSIAHTASNATQDATPAVSKPQGPAQALTALPSTGDLSEPKEEVPSTAAPGPLAQLASKSGKLSHPGQAPEVTEHTISEPGLSLGEGLAASPSQEAAAVSTSQAAVEKPKKKKRELQEEHGNSSQPASHAQALAAAAAAAAGGKAVPAAGKQHSPNQQTNSVEQSTAEAATGVVAPYYCYKCVLLLSYAILLWTLPMYPSTSGIRPSLPFSDRVFPLHPPAPPLHRKMSSRSHSKALPNRCCCSLASCSRACCTRRVRHCC